MSKVDFAKGQLSNWNYYHAPEGQKLIAQGTALGYKLIVHYLSASRR